MTAPAKEPRALLYDLNEVRSRLEALSARLVENATRERATSLLLEKLPVLVWSTDAELRVREVMGAGLERLGWSSPEEAVGETLQAFLHRDGEDAAVVAHRRALEGHSQTVEFNRGASAFYAHIAPLCESLGGAVEGVVGVALDISARKQAEDTLQRIEMSTSAIRTALPDLIFHFSRSGIFLEHHAPDPGALLMEPEAFLGKGVCEVLPDLGPAFSGAIERAISTGSVQILEYDLCISDEDRDFEARFAHINDDEVLCVVREISRRERAIRALHTSQEQLSTYHDIVVHDLSNFSMSMRALLERILSERDGPLEGVQRQLLQRANRQSYEMSRLAENARVLTLLHSDSFEALATTSINVRECLENAIQRIESTHFDQRIAIELHCDEDLSIRSSTHLETVIVNLLDNAVRHGVPDEDDLRHVEIKVFELLERIQVRFRNPSHLTEDAVQLLLDKPESSSNLGIALVKSVISHLGGDIRARIVQRDARLFEFNFNLPKAPSVWDGS